MKYKVTAVVEFADAPPLVCNLESDAPIGQERAGHALFAKYGFEVEDGALFLIFDPDHINLDEG